ncbi:hypothetical protein RSOLAG22IIIB_09749 [Rhizoctonia solani]|uniref:RNase H type-1 domain-containing protein n=1 Tax=Rhizoctonia solani TaxID=456999 RepID=A0A0K6FZU1_9AGAM|nr:hypothetical protein RSOLAG22IIIB_09749 [Rhizoctonia solani]
MFNHFRGAVLGLQRPLYSGVTLSFVRHASSKTPDLKPKILQQSGRRVYTNSASLAQEQHTPIQCWVDANIKHGLIAVVIGNKYKAFRTKPQEGTAGRNIHWAETVAFELLAHVLLAQKFTGSVTVHSDSKAAIGAFSGLKNRDHLVAASSARLQAQRPLWPFQIQAQWVASEYNVADPLTRGKPIASGYEELDGSFELSETLEPFVYQN